MQKYDFFLTWQKNEARHPVGGALPERVFQGKPGNLTDYQLSDSVDALACDTDKIGALRKVGNVESQFPAFHLPLSAFHLSKTRLAARWKSCRPKGLSR